MAAGRTKLIAEVVRTTREVRERAERMILSEVAPPAERLPLVIDTLESAVSAMDAMTSLLLHDAASRSRGGQT